MEFKAKIITDKLSGRILYSPDVDRWYGCDEFEHIACKTLTLSGNEALEQWAGKDLYGPAIVYLKYGKLHRDNGPAIKYIQLPFCPKRKKSEYWFNGEFLSNKRNTFLKKVKLLSIS